MTIFGLILENAFKGGLIVAFFGAAKETLGTKVRGAVWPSGQVIISKATRCPGFSRPRPRSHPHPAAHPTPTLELLYVHPQIGPLLVGTVAGCGGALLGGLSPIKASVPKGVWSSAAACAFVALATDASYTEGLPIDLPSLSKVR